MVVTIIVFLIVISVVVTAHELGHFIIAKLNGIRVLEFAIGMGPVILKFNRGGTRYALRLLPIGGACMFEGEDGIFSDDNSKNDSGEKPEGAFNDANVWARIATVFAGPFFNIILAYLFALIVLGFSGAVVLPAIGNLTEGYPAAEAGLQVGDVITRVDGERVYLSAEVSLISQLNSGEPIAIEYERNGERHNVTVIPKFSEEDNRYYIGFSYGEYLECKGINLIKYSAYYVRYNLKLTIKSLLMLVQGKVPVSELSGPVGIAVLIDDQIETAKPYGLSAIVLDMINFSLFLSVNLGIMNLLPIPALDGGRLLFMFLEVLRGKPVSPEKEGMVHFVGFVCLMILMVFVFYNDLTRIFFKGA